MSNFRNANGVDFDNLFEPEVGGNGAQDPNYRLDNGVPLRYAALSSGSKIADVNARSANGSDLTNLWAGKGTVGYLVNPPTYPQNFNRAFPPTSGLSMPSPAFFEDVTATQTTSANLFGVVRVDFNPDGTWAYRTFGTNFWNDDQTWWNSMINANQTMTNKGHGNFTTNLQPSNNPSVSYGGNWLQNPAAGAGSPYLLTVNFSPVFDYTATASTLYGGSIAYTQGLTGCSDNSKIAVNGGFVVQGGTVSTGGAQVYVLDSVVSVCYAFRLNVCPPMGNYKGANGSLNWLTYVNATIGINLASAGGGNPKTSVSGNLAMGIFASWADYSFGKTYTPSDADTPPWNGLSVGAGQQGQWNWGSGGGGGGGGDGGCVLEDSFMIDGSKAQHLLIGKPLIVTDPWKAGENTVEGKVLESSPEYQPCVLVETEEGAKLGFSLSAPIPTRDNGYQMGHDLQGQYIPIAKSTGIHVGHTSFQWSRVVKITDLGMRVVRRIYVENRCFWASADGEWFILHHNLKNQPHTGGIQAN